jgi:hypothetical protein
MKKNHFIWIGALAALSLVSCGTNSTKVTEEEGATADSTAVEAKADERPSPLVIKEGEIAGKKMSVHYGSPAVKGRALWGDLVPYNVVWRTGANEASYIDLAQDLTVEGKTLAAGKYSIFTIPKEKGAWTVIFNSQWELEHGHFQYDEKFDVLRVEANPSWETNSQERLSFEIEAPGLVIRWDKLKLPIAIQ